MTNHGQPILEAWQRHLLTNTRSVKRLSFSSIAEEDFRKTFRSGIMNHLKLTNVEKLELISGMGL